MTTVLKRRARSMRARKRRVVSPRWRETLAKLREWAAAHREVRRLWVFGSRLKGEQRADSNLDVAMEIDAIGYDESARVTWVAECHEWESALTALTGYTVDLNEFDPTNFESNVVSYVRRCGALIYTRVD
jgi:predicted nucleotidyltransferase